MHKLLRSISLGIALIPIQLFAQDTTKPEALRDSTNIKMENELTEVVIQSRQILGSKFQARNRTGSAYYISPQEIKKMGYTDINRMLKSVPGVNMYEEDGFGLRPNISLRGTKAERSERITIMEDGILAAPAPYSAPAAYYFPNAARMYAVEVLKGSSQVQYGPFTTGGAINLVSNPIPDQKRGHLTLSYGSYGTLKSHVLYGNSHRYLGYSVEYLRFQSDGFKQMEKKRDIGLYRNDLIAKLRVNSDPDADTTHSLELKFGYADEKSHETYVGLSEQDFRTSPFTRYAGSQMDNMQTAHEQYALTYILKHDFNFNLVANAYHNHFHRNWYKLAQIRAGNTSGEVRSLESVLAEPELSEEYFGILTGQGDYDGEGLILRANNRGYYSSGVQAKAEYITNLSGYYLTMEGGARFHTDMEDRYQWDDGYGIKGGEMYLYYPGIHGSQSNRITSAKAFASYILAKIAKGNLTITTGLRYEDIALHLNKMGKADPRRTGMNREEADNTAKVLIPSFGLNYKAIKGGALFFGIHKGFAPPGVRIMPRNVAHPSLIPEGGFEQQKAENSINMELGARYTYKELHAELIGFRNNYSNMVGSDLAASGGLGTLDQFNIGKAIVQGAEFLLQYQPLPRHWRIRMPIQLTYTYTDTKMLNAFDSNSWGKVDVGDEIPYIYRHALNVRVGLEHRWGELNISYRYNGDMRTRPGQGSIAHREMIPAHTVWDASMRIPVYRKVNLTVNAVNLLNTTYLSSRHPAGLRPGHPFGVYVGISADL